jgi:CubicO group peptidase (beta-lactamase class C family)
MSRTFSTAILRKPVQPSMTLCRRTLLAAGLAAPFAPCLAHAQDYPGAAAYSAQRNGRSLLVMRGGEVIYEDYPNGGGAGVSWELASGTKSFCGIMAAALAQDGRLSLDERCSDTLSEWRSDARAAITIRDLLTLTSGIAGGRIGRPPPYADAVALPADAAPGARFQYGPAPFQIFGEIVRRKINGDPLGYLQARIFDPLGIRPQRWRRGTDGHPHLPSGAALTARDWAAFGRFVMSPRRGDPAVHRETMSACWQGTRANPGYGLTWWLLRPGLIGPTGNERRRAGIPSSDQLDAMPFDVRMAAGAGDQRLYLIPERDLIFVRQAELTLRGMRRSDWNDAEFLRFFV